MAHSKPKPVKKSVSFIQDASDGANVTEETKYTSIKQGPAVPSLKRNLAAFPLHNLLILVGLFHYGLTENVDTVLLKGFITSLPLQASYAYLLANNVHKKLKSANIPLLVVSSIVVSILLAVPTFAMLVILGAPLSNFKFRTACLALHVSQQIFTPLLVVYRLDFQQFKLLFDQDRIYLTIFQHPVLCQVLLTLGCCWLGVIPIPLDWDRPWQQWPITLLIGAYTGGIVGSVVSFVVNLVSR
ncbi:GPI11 [Candida theae]|uniref:Glycosylphosphatidylinositol anchor biosynthesis protein 11 n=1 Tax=Candida theae TaxID=1198502 RepID=A0AAD5G0U2_9ASCO|nr:GPI11 [Candida theae]KAI5968341.1 GPI11 [Candida theae]